MSTQFKATAMQQRESGERSKLAIFLVLYNIYNSDLKHIGKQIWGFRGSKIASIENTNVFFHLTLVLCNRAKNSAFIYSIFDTSIIMTLCPEACTTKPDFRLAG